MKISFLGCLGEFYTISNSSEIFKILSVCYVSKSRTLLPILCESCGPVGGIGAPRNRDIEGTHFSYKPSLILKILCSL